MAALVAEFERGLDSLDVTCRRTGAAQFSHVLDEAIQEPAIGSPLPFDGLSYDDTPVVTDPTARELSAAKTGVTPATLGIANYGSIVVTATESGDGPISLFPEKHVAILPSSAIVADMEATFAALGDRIRERGDDEIIATGPSATADMGELVIGAHGPKEVAVVVITDR